MSEKIPETREAPEASRRPEGEAPRYASRWESSLSRWPRDGLGMDSRGYQDVGPNHPRGLE
ncbi:hypothetical protein PHLCEN_2v2214 [Hermanssonia centrifuga]|uniref:Uncharacterized protein n=1 Tax=Hermanssonia centrifuga TaxID=98765 RepID=A0A2R6RPV0_9APHY|nr:hypothetical protein PHLCEN_2v2214 [Hermanssonia centrifuga]